MLKMRVSGNAAVQAELKRLAKWYPRGMSVAVYKLGVAILSDALPRTPIEFGVLRSSAYVSPPQGEGAKAQVEVGYGTRYAIQQHERTDYQHPRGGTAKFLEMAIDSVAPRALPLLAKWVKEGGAWGQSQGVPTRPVVAPSTKTTPQQSRRFGRAARNVTRRTRGSPIAKAAVKQAKRTGKQLAKGLKKLQKKLSKSISRGLKSIGRGLRRRRRRR